MFNVFHKHGDIKEVVIPAKRDKRNKRFGFARFDRVEDPRKFAEDLDTIKMGGNKISVNLSRFQRQVRNNRSDDRSAGRRGERNNTMLNLVSGHDNNHHHQQNSYAQVVRKGSSKGQEGKMKTVVLTYEAEEIELLKESHALSIFTIAFFENTIPDEAQPYLEENQV
ncbi:hypothetical protein TSUD_381180 [Trifolium subterraneum]|uniref:RRM domain-containing protein n=1 Tax=Trifolium subterraneum TaxID=3900 RepID=A0A2Z6MDY9_TRISU|nr:hypothetical protein TSUD_381180 [Trifolium subterraneum]